MATSRNPPVCIPPRRVQSTALPIVSKSAKRKTPSAGSSSSVLISSDSSNPTGSRVIKSPPNRSSKSQLGLADTKTPFRPGSARRNTEGSSNSFSRSRTTNASRTSATPTATYARPHNASVAAPAPTGQKEMDGYLESEMRGAIFCDPHFVDNFLNADPETLVSVVNRCKSDTTFGTLPSKIKSERQLYEPVRKLLNDIKAAVDQERGNFQDAPTFEDTSATHIPSYEPDTSMIKPDLVLFEDETRHWETVRMPIEVKKLTTYLKVGVKQLTRYARAVFAHQIHRRHLYGLVICGLEATFVRFDRAGILYSPPIDMRKQQDEFTCAFGSLMMMDEQMFGYDTAFTTRRNEEGRLEYYVDLPEAAFERVPSKGNATSTSTSVPGPSNQPAGKARFATKRLKVMERLCHRKSIRGRATIVLRLREVLTTGTSIPLHKGATTRQRAKGKEVREGEEKADEVLGTRDYVLKMIWRDPKKESEGDMMKKLVGAFGLAQYLWHSDVYKSCQCEGAVGNHCEDKTPDRDHVWASDNLRDIDIEVTEETGETEDGAAKDVQYRAVDTNKCNPVYAHRTRRTYSRILMSSIGEPLWAADSPRRFLTAILDAILGYWRLVNMGYLHRDISDGNVLMLRDDQEFTERDWKCERTKIPEAQAEILAESEKLLQETLVRLDRDPTGMLADFDLHATHFGMNQQSAKDGRGGRQPGILVDEDPQDIEEGRSLKRRKTNTGASSIISSAEPSEEKVREMTPLEQDLRETAEVAEGRRKDVDFRTGTPTFMSVRVLNVPVGEEYQHSFLDDIESFFWLIIWSVAEHLNPGVDEPTSEAYKLLNALSQPDYENMASRKHVYLSNCYFPSKKRAFEKTLQSFRNDWASDLMVSSVIFRLGYILANAHLTESEKTPVELFPEVINIFLDVLKPSKDNSQNLYVP